MLTTLLLHALAAAPQGGIKQQTPPSLAPSLEFAAAPANARFAPFVDSGGAPERTAILATGAGDFDGDRNPEVWLLSGGGPSLGRISVQMPLTADLGRFRHYATLPPGTYRDGATYRTNTTATDFAVLVDPHSPALAKLFYLPPPIGGPRGGQWLVQPSLWIPGDGSYEVETADFERDGHDDIAVLREIRNGATVVGTTIEKMVMGTNLGYLAHESSVRLSLPFRLERLRLLDANGDARADVLVDVPGLGVAVLVDDRQGSFAFFGGISLVPGALRDLFTGDFDRDGRSDFGIVLQNGVVLCRSQPTGPVPIPLPNPAGTGDLATAALLDGYGEPAADVVAFAASGATLVIHPYDPVGGRFLQPVVRSAPDDGQGSYAGPGVLGRSTLVHDLDGDGDLDVAVQLADGAHWLTLFGPTVDLRPIEVKTVSRGPVAQTGFLEEAFEVALPEAFFAQGVPQVEVAVFLEDPITKEQVYWTRTFPTANPVTRKLTFSIMVMSDVRNLAWLLATGYVQHFGAMTAGGPSTVTIHGKNVAQRFRSTLTFTTGKVEPGGPNGSANGVKWKVVAAPPLPVDDKDLLPWN